jgi:hypothetical protein
MREIEAVRLTNPEISGRQRFHWWAAARSPLALYYFIMP